MDVYCTLYNIVGDVSKKDGKVDVSKIGKYNISFNWDDSIIVDKDTELQKNLQLLSAGLKSKVEVRAWAEGETEQQAQDALEKISRENQEAIERNMMVSSQMGQQVQKDKAGQPNEGGDQEADQQDNTSQQQMMKNLSEQGQV